MKSDALSAALLGGTRSAILALLYGNADRAFYMREIMRSINAANGAAQRELGLLAKFEVVRRTEKYGRVFFQAEPDCPVYERLKAFFRKTADAATLIRSALKPLSNRIEAAFIHGSFARGEETPESDVDLIIIGDAEFRGISYRLMEPQKKLNREINLIVYAPAEFRKKIREKSHFVSSIMKEPKIFLIGDENVLEGLARKRLAG